MGENMDQRTQIEFDRIKAGPHQGYFTLLHHQGPIIEESENVMERVGAILRDKPPAEHYTRLRHIYPIPLAAWKAYQEAIASSQKVALESIPNCGWDGKTIFGVRS